MPKFNDLAGASGGWGAEDAVKHMPQEQSERVQPLALSAPALWLPLPNSHHRCCHQQYLPVFEPLCYSLLIHKPRLVLLAKCALTLVPGAELLLAFEVETEPATLTDFKWDELLV